MIGRRTLFALVAGAAGAGLAACVPASTGGGSVPASTSGAPLGGTRVREGAGGGNDTAVGTFPLDTLQGN